MSSIETRHNAATDTLSYRVCFRHRGKQMKPTFATMAAAEKWKSVLDTIGPDAALILLEAPEPAAPAVPTVAELIDHHIEHITGADDGTLARYRRLSEQHLRPRFEKIPADKLTRDDVSRWVLEARLLNGEAPAPKTLHNWHSLLSDALSSAVEAGTLPANVAKGVRLPRLDAAGGEEMVFLTHSEADVLYAHVPDRWKPLVLTLLLTGMRFGEATALTPGALDRAHNEARIHTAWKQSGRQGAPKSRKSRRTAKVPDAVFDAISPLVEGKKPSDLIFLSPRGLRVRSGNFYNSVWGPLMDRVEPLIHKRPRVHDLRHTYASWAIQSGTPLPVIQRQLGHEHITTTIDTYGHLARADFEPLLHLGAALSPQPAAIEA